MYNELWDIFSKCVIELISRDISLDRIEALNSKLLRQFTEEMSDERTTIFVERDGTDIVAFALVQFPHDYLIGGDRDMIIKEFLIKKKYHGRKVFYNLYKQLDDYCKKIKPEYVIFPTPNKKLQKMFEKRGFMVEQVMLTKKVN